MSSPAGNLIEIILFPLDSDDDERRNLLPLLSDDETQRAARYRFDIHRNRFIMGRGTIRQILAARGKCSPGEISFELNRYGKPTLARPESTRHLQFNASSSDTIGAIAISNDFPLGLDIEKIKSTNAQDYDGIVKSQFTSDEYDWYQKHANPGRIRVFFEFWTCKEAYLKALGIGLSGRLDSFSINLEGAEPWVSHTDIETGGQSRLSLSHVDVGGDYVVCLAVPEKTSRIELSYW